MRAEEVDDDAVLHRRRTVVVFTAVAALVAHFFHLLYMVVTSVGVATCANSTSDGQAQAHHQASEFSLCRLRRCGGGCRGGRVCVRERRTEQRRSPTFDPDPDTIRRAAFFAVIRSRSRYRLMRRTEQCTNNVVAVVLELRAQNGVVVLQRYVADEAILNSHEMCTDVAEIGKECFGWVQCIRLLVEVLRGGRRRARLAKVTR